VSADQPPASWMTSRRQMPPVPFIAIGSPARLRATCSTAKCWSIASTWARVSRL